MIITLNKVKEIVQKSKLDSYVFGGVFDLVHAGHVDFLKKAKKDNSILIYVAPADDFVKSRKGVGRPVQDQKTRSVIVDNMKQVDYTILANNLLKPTDVPLINYVLKIKPSYFILGEDSLERLKHFLPLLKDNSIKVIIQKIKKIDSTTNIILKIKNKTNPH